jgi:hypothetical protein
MNKEALAEFVVARLNEFLKVDPKAIEDLIEARVPCNEALADHPTMKTSSKSSV